MTVRLDECRDEIRDLFIGQRKTLAEVQKVIKDKHDITASDRTWKSRLKQWGCRKRDHVDSPSTVTDLPSTATTPSPFTPSAFNFSIPTPTSQYDHSTRLGPLVPETKNDMESGELNAASESQTVLRGDSPILGAFSTPLAMPQDVEMLDVDSQDNMREEQEDISLPIQATLSQTAHQNSTPTPIPAEVPRSSWTRSPSQETMSSLPSAGPTRDNTDLRRNISIKAYLFNRRPDSYRSVDSGGSSLFRFGSVSGSNSEAGDKSGPSASKPAHTTFKLENIFNRSPSRNQIADNTVEAITEEHTSQDAGYEYFPPHAAPSRCIFARHQPYNKLLSVQDGCPHCGANRFHYLASIAAGMRVDELSIQLRALKHYTPTVNDSDMFGNTPLHFLASSRPQLGHILAFRQAGALTYAANHHNETFLHVLNPHALGRDIQMVLQLYSKQINSSKRILFHRLRNHDGQSILHRLAAQKPDSTQVPIIWEWFKNMQTNVGARDKDGLTPYDYYSSKPKPSPPPKQSRPISDGSQSVQQLQRKNMEMQKIVDNCSANPFCEDLDGHNALLCLAYMVMPARMRFGMIDDCITYGVDLDHFDIHGKTPIHAFIFKERSSNGRPEDDKTTASYVEKLINAGANVNVRDRDGETPLHFATKWGHDVCTKLLLQHGADPNAVNNRRRSIIQEAESWLDPTEPDVFGRIKVSVALVRASGGRDDLDDTTQQQMRQQNM
ncbi:MAG: hypothetical protein Q9160_006401 [Pyrenula sp. 1 TL-2023]